MNGLYSIKPRFVRALSGVEDRLVARGTSADSLSFAAVLVSAAAAAAIAAGHLVHPWFWFLVVVFAIVRLALNALDGSVARRTGTARPFGKVINEICDRIADALFVAPLLLVAPSFLVLATFIVIALISVCGCLGEVVGSERLTQGPMGKADRCAVLAAAAAIAATTHSTVPFGGALVVISAAGLVTVGLRVRTLHATAGEAADVR